ncbi:hypothetical protein MXB_2613, partial [Myxobolus squamalis]
MESVINKLAKYNISYDFDELKFENDLKEETDRINSFIVDDPIGFINKYSNRFDMRDLNIIQSFWSQYGYSNIVENLKDRINCIHKNKINLVVQNRRYFYILKCIKENSYFSLPSIKQRYPLLYDQYIGNCNQEQPDKSSVESLSKFLLDHLQKIQLRKKLNEERFQEDFMSHDEDEV